MEFQLEPLPLVTYDEYGLVDRDLDERRISKVGYCYEVADCLDGYCIHAPECPDVGRSWTGPNSTCIQMP